MRERLTAVLLSLVDRMTVEWSFSPSPLMPLISCCFPSAGWLAGWPPIPVPHASNWGLKTAGRQAGAPQKLLNALLLLLLLQLDQAQEGVTVSVCLDVCYVHQIMSQG